MTKSEIVSRIVTFILIVPTAIMFTIYNKPWWALAFMMIIAVAWVLDAVYNILQIVGNKKVKK